MAASNEEGTKEDPRIRNIRKKLVQIVAFEDQLQADPEMIFTEDQRAKVSRKEALEAELDTLLHPPADDGPACKEQDSTQVEARCGKCNKHAEQLSAPWSSWHCSTCERADLTIHSPAFGCQDGESCLCLDDWAICLDCAKAGATTRVKPQSEASEETRAPASETEAEVSETDPEVKRRCGECCELVRSFTAPWSDWYCSSCGSDGLTSSSLAYGCQFQDKCKPLDTWAICGDCARSCKARCDSLEGMTFKRMLSHRWEDDPVAVEDIAPPTPSTSSTAGKQGKYAMEDMEMLEAIQPFAPATQASERLRGLVKATTDLSMEAFGTDVLEKVSRKGKWKLTLLARHSTEGAWCGLLGFMAYKSNGEVQSISIAKLAVVPEERGQGHGHRLVNWSITMAKKQPNIMYLSLTSLPAAVRFYKQMGFRAVEVDLAKLTPEPDEDEEYIEDQVYMEYACKKGRSAGKRR